MTESSFPKAVLFATGGFLVLAAEFVLLYVLTTVACLHHYTDATLPASVIVTTIAAAASVALFVKARRAGSPGGPQEAAGVSLFLARLAAIVAALALIAIAILGIPALVVTSPCAT